MCEHCRGGILRQMPSANTPDELVALAGELRERGARGLLISGGSDNSGVVPLERFLAAIGAVREQLGLKVLVHTGATDGRLASGLAEAGIEGAMIDIIGDEDTLRQVCHLDSRSIIPIESSLYNLADAGVPLAPHIVIGLHFGSIRGESRAIEIASRFPLASLVLVALNPLAGTAMAGVQPPPPEYLGELFIQARMTLPDTPVLLGCERPAGEHKLMTDMLALRAGLSGIAFPAEGVIREARKMGLNPILSEQCCAMLVDEVEAAD